MTVSLRQHRISLFAAIFTVLVPTAFAGCYSSCKFSFCPDAPGSSYALGRQDVSLTAAICDATGVINVGHVDETGEGYVVEGNSPVPISKYHPSGLRQNYPPSFFKSFSVGNNPKTDLSGVGHETLQQNQADYLNGKCIVLPLRAYQILNRPGGSVTDNKHPRGTDFVDCVSFVVIVPPGYGSKKPSSQQPPYQTDPSHTQSPVSTYPQSTSAPTNAPHPENTPTPVTTAYPTETEAPSTTYPLETEAPVTTYPMQTEAPVTSYPTQTDAPATTYPTETEAPSTTYPLETEAPVTTYPTQTEAPVTSYPTQTGAPATTYPTETEAPVTSYPTQTGAPATTYPTETEAPSTTYPLETDAPVTTYPTQTEARVTSYPTQTDAPATTYPSETEAPVTTYTKIPVRTSYPSSSTSVSYSTSEQKSGLQTPPPMDSLESITCDVGKGCPAGDKVAWIYSACSEKLGDRSKADYWIFGALDGVSAVGKDCGIASRSGKQLCTGTFQNVEWCGEGFSCKGGSSYRPQIVKCIASDGEVCKLSPKQEKDVIIEKTEAGSDFFISCKA